MAVPILQSLLLADHVYRDQQTGKHIICGVFSTIFFTPNAQPAPHQNMPHGGGGGAGAGHGAIGGDSGGHSGGHSGGGAGHASGEGSEPVTKPQPIQNLVQAGSPYLYFSVTELTERKTFEIRYVDLHSNRSLFQAEVPVECDDPLKTIEISMPLPRLPLVALEERSYAVEVLCEGQLLGSHRVLARISPGSVPPLK